MPKRFTDTEIWQRQYWFKKLKPNYKLAFLYIKDNCDHAGLWKIDVITLMEDLGLEGFDLEDFVKAVNVEYDPVKGSKGFKNRLETLSKGFLWITGFIQFQYESKGKTVSPRPPAILSALRVLEGFNLLEKSINKGYVTLSEPLPKGFGRVKDKDKDRDKDIKEVGGVGEETISEKPPERKITHVDDPVQMMPLEEARKLMLSSERWQESILRHLKDPFGYHLTFSDLHQWIELFIKERSVEGDLGLKERLNNYQVWFKNWVKVELKRKGQRGFGVRPQHAEPVPPYHKKNN